MKRFAVNPSDNHPAHGNNTQKIAQEFESDPSNNLHSLKKIMFKRTRKKKLEATSTRKKLILFPL